MPGGRASREPGCWPKEDKRMKALLWIVAIIFLIGLLVVFGIFDFIF